MKHTTVVVLLVEDNPGDARLIREMLAEAKGLTCVVEWVERLASGVERIARGGIDVVLLDLGLPDSSGLDGLRRIRGAMTELPAIVVMSGLDDEQVAVNAIHGGAQDYLIKGQVDSGLLSRAIRYAVERNHAELELQKAHAELERRVLERTTELRAANLRLTEEIEERKRTESALRQSEQKFHDVFDQTFQLSGLLNTDGTLIQANKTALKLIGVDESSVLGQPFWETPWWTHSPELQNRVRQAIEEASRGQFVRFEVTHRACDGAIRYIDFSLKPVKDEQGRTVELLSEGRDITERKQVEEAKEKLEAQIRQVQKLEAIGTLAGGIAHDFNNILSAILSYTELACMDAKDQPEILESLSEVYKAGERAKDLVRQILAFSRQAKPERKPIRLHPVIKEALHLLRSTLPTTIEICNQIQVNSPVVMADATQVHQVLLNLCTNAAHAMLNKPGRLTVSLSSCMVDAALAGSIPDLHPGLWVKLAVTDTGHGMDSETLKRIFDPFFTTKAPNEGTGLGLAVVHGIVKDHQGAISVESQPGVGTTFQVFFPVCQSQESMEGPALSSPRGNGEHILFVDDDAPVRAIGKKTLERYGYQVTLCDHPQKAIELFQLQPQSFDLVVTDLTMPSMTGVDLAMSIMQLRHDMPVILATGYGGAFSEETARSIGIVDILPKPISPAALCDSVHKALHCKSTFLSGQ